MNSIDQFGLRSALSRVAMDELGDKTAQIIDAGYCLDAPNPVAGYHASHRNGNRVFVCPEFSWGR